MTGVDRRGWGRRVFHWVLGLTGAGLGGWGLLRGFERAQVYQPTRAWHATGADLGRPWEEVVIRTGDGVDLSAWYFPAAEGAAYREVAVVISHGNGGNISHRLGLYELLLGIGVHVLAYDYRGYGRSAGRVSEEGTYRDGEAAVDWLVGRGFREGNIVVHGESLGGGVAAELARRRPGLRGVILRSTFTSVVDLGRELFPFLPVRSLASIRYDTETKLREIQVPVMILHSREDRLVRFSHAEANHAAAREPKWLREIGGDHNDQPEASPEVYAAAVGELLEATRGRGGG